MKVHHVGYVVQNIEKAKQVFLGLGFSFDDTVEDNGRAINICFGKNGNEIVELVTPLQGKDSPVSKLLKKNGPMPYHFCFETRDIDDTVRRLQEEQKGWMVIAKACAAPAIDNARVSFLYQKDIGLVELVEVK